MGKVKVKTEEEAPLAVATFSQIIVVPVGQALFVEASDYCLEHRLHFSDAFVYATTLPGKLSFTLVMKTGER